MGIIALNETERRSVLMKRRIISAAAVTVTLALTVITAGMVLGSAEEAPVQPQPLKVNDLADMDGYIVKIFDGKIAVYTSDFTETPAVITDYDTSLLREADKRMLEAGIAVERYEDVLYLIEDFSS